MRKLVEKIPPSSVIAAAVMLIVSPANAAEIKNAYPSPTIDCDSISGKTKELVGCPQKGPGVITVDVLKARILERVAATKQNPSKGSYGETDYTWDLSRDRTFIAGTQLLLRELGYFNDRVDGVYEGYKLWEITNYKTISFCPRYEYLHCFDATPEDEKITITGLGSLKEPKTLDRLEEVGAISHTTAATFRLQKARGLKFDGVPGEEVASALSEIPIK